MTRPCMSCEMGSHRLCVAVITGRCGCLCRPPMPCDPARSIVWTGDNDAEVVAFATDGHFTVEVGVPLDDADRNPDHVDRTVLVVYPHDFDGDVWRVDLAIPGDRVHADGRVVRAEVSP